MSELVSEFLDEPFPTMLDPMIFDGTHYPDGDHRVVMGEPGAGGARSLYKASPDFQAWTLVKTNWMSAAGEGGVWTFQDATWDGGRFLLYQNDGTDTSTAVWTGTPADVENETITRVGQVLANAGDCGAFYDAASGLVHIYAEDSASPFGSVSSSRLLHYTTPPGNLTDATFVGVAIDTGGAWGTGDPDVFEHDGSYWLIADYTEDHPTYWVALYRSTDLTNWSLVEKRWSAETGVHGGDWDVIRTAGGMFALGEFAHSGNGVGLWAIRERGAPSVAGAVESGSDVAQAASSGTGVRSRARVVTQPTA